MTNGEAFERGADDARRDRPRIFRSTRSRGIIPTVDDPQADDWSDEQRYFYCEGYDSAYEAA